MTHDSILRILAPRAVGQTLTRRGFLGALGAGALLAACGREDDAIEYTGTRGATGPLEDRLNLYTWAEYQDPANERLFARSHGPRVSIDVFDSNEAMLAKLELAGGTAGYDICVPSGVYLPQMVSRGLLLEIDPSRIPNLANVDPALRDQPWDPGNRYSVVKNWGSTGYVYDRRAIAEELHGWADFFRAAALPQVSGRVSVVASAADLAGMVFWRDGIDWRTERQEDLDHAERALLAELAPHIRAFDSYPVAGMLDGSFVLSQAWNGDARSIVVADPERYRWVLGAPATELWIDHWCILSTARSPEAAHAWINFMLDPEVSAREVEYHGYNTGVRGTEQLLPDDVEAREMIYFTPEERQRMVPGEVNAAQERLVSIYGRVRSRAAA
jgi:spermidine/putrescine transport system substrate-binding protein